MSVDLSDPRELTDANVTGHNGEKLGKVDNVYMDNETGRPEWASVKTGMFGSHVSLVPLATAEYRDGALQVPYSKQQVQDAPHHDPGKELSVDDERELFSHYGVEYGGDTATARSQETVTGGDQGQRAEHKHEHEHGGDEHSHARHAEAGTTGHDTSGPTTDNAMTRSEEELHVGTETQERGRARLRKYVVTENVTQTVPVSREEVRLEREPITENNAPAAHDGPAISEEEHEVVLHEERPVVGKETVAKERVRLGTETHHDEEQISDEVRKEQIDTDGDMSETAGTSREDSASGRR
jgi:uncharacterized protein (TIGR02271 family)